MALHFPDIALGILLPPGCTLRVCPTHSVSVWWQNPTLAGYNLHLDPSCSRGTMPRLLPASQQRDGSHWAISRATSMVDIQKKACPASTIHLLKRRSQRIWFCLICFSGAVVHVYEIIYSAMKTRNVITYAYIYFFNIHIFNTPQTFVPISNVDALSSLHIYFYQKTVGSSRLHKDGDFTASPSYFPYLEWVSTERWHHHHHAKTMTE